jgi:RNA polymerase sigma-70 factor (ECF subfamily)
LQFYYGAEERYDLNPDASEIEQLLTAAGQGQAGAVDRLLDGHRDLLRRAIGLRLDRRVSARLDVSDVVQDTCLEAAKRLPEFLARRPMPFALWLRWLARERVLTVHRQHLRADKRAVGLEAPPQ